MKSKRILLPILVFLALGSGAFPVEVDGTVSEGEYDDQVSFADGDLMLYWSLDRETAYFGIRALAEGWVAVGFDPVRAMDQADIIFGWIEKDGTVGALDTFSTGLLGPHPPDEELGGTQDLLAFAGSQSGGLTTFEFSRLLDTGDRYDKPLPPEETIRIILAYSNSTDYRDLHTHRGGTVISLAGRPAPSPGDGGPQLDLYSLLYPIHAILMSAGFVLLLAGMLFPRYFKGKRWWLKIHRWFGTGGSVIGVVGVGLAVYMIARTTGSHLRIVHSYFGLITVLLMICTPLLGHFMLKIRKNPSGVKRARVVHRWIGRVTLLLMAASIGLGLSRVWVMLF